MSFEFILKFLKDLSKHNDRTWFEKNKPRYLEAKQTFEDFIAALLKELTKVDDKLAGLEPKKLPFRIYRDVRFSKDKSPYKVNMGAGFSPNGKLVQEPGYYIHIEPGNKSFLAGGIYMPDAANLAKVRQEIDYNAERLSKILKDKTFKKHFGGLDEFDKLKTMPKGYSKDHPHIEFLKLKSFIVTHMYTDKEVMDKKFIKTIASHGKVIRPLIDFIREAQA
jgi:uncharacterized protein (TIGR02453 family)